MYDHLRTEVIESRCKQRPEHEISKFEFKSWQGQNTEGAINIVAEALNAKEDQVRSHITKIKAINTRQYTKEYKPMNFVGKTSIAELGRTLGRNIFYGKTRLGKRKWIVCEKCYTHHSAISLSQEKCMHRPDSKPGSRTVGAWKRWRQQPNIAEDLKRMGTSIEKLDKVFKYKRS